MENHINPEDLLEFANFNQNNDTTKIGDIGDDAVGFADAVVSFYPHINRKKTVQKCLTRIHLMRIDMKGKILVDEMANDKVKWRKGRYCAELPKK